MVIAKRAVAIGLEIAIVTARGEVPEFESGNPIVTETVTVDLQAGGDRAREGQATGHQTVEKDLANLGVDLEARGATATDGVHLVDPMAGGRSAAEADPVMIAIKGRGLKWLLRDRGFQTISARPTDFVTNTT